MESVKETEHQSASVAVSHKTRVSLADIENAIATEHCFLAGEAIEALGHPNNDSLNILTVCILTMKNGFTVIGKAAPADAVNFNAELGKKFAREDAVRQLWPLMGFALRDKLVA